MIPHFILRQNKGEYLIIRMGDEFHIIDCSEALTREKRLAVLESGCTPAQMQEMGLSGMTIPKSDIEALTVTGCAFQDDVIFYLSKKKLAFWFPKAYEQKKVDDFFRGIPRKQVKTRTRLKGGKNIDWRLKEQDEVCYQKLRPVGWVYNSLCVLICVYPFILNSLDIRFHGWLVFGMCLIAVVLDIVLPEYFSIIFYEDRTKRRIKIGGGRRAIRTRSIRLGPGMAGIIVMFGIVCDVHYNLVEQQVLLPALIMAAVGMILLVLFCREFQEELKERAAALLVYLCMAFAFNYLAFVPHFNYALAQEPNVMAAPITDRHISAGNSTSYYCTVMLPNGREMDVQVSSTEYGSLEPGDTLDIQYGTGFFGIEYAIDG